MITEGYCSEDKSNSNRKFVFALSAILIIFFWEASLSYGYDYTEHSIDEILSKNFSAAPELLKHIDNLIEKNPEHPRILELKFYRAGRSQNHSLEPERVKLVIAEFNKLAKEAGGHTEMGYRCKIAIGSNLHHHLGDFEAAYKHYKELEKHPVLSGSDIKVDLKRTDLYIRIAETAYNCGNGKLNEVEKYSRLVMAYPYLRIEDRKIYRKFFFLYRRAAKVLLYAFNEDLEKLMSIKIYPSHTQLCIDKQEFINRIIDSENTIDESIEDLNDNNDMFESSKPSQKTIVEPNTSETLTTSEDSNKENNTLTEINTIPPTVSKPKPSRNQIKKWAIGTVLALALLITLQFVLKKQKSK